MRLATWDLLRVVQMGYGPDLWLLDGNGGPFWFWKCPSDKWEIMACAVVEVPPSSSTLRRAEKG